MGRLMHSGTQDRIARARLRAAVPSEGVLWRAFLVAALLLGLLVAAGGAGAMTERRVLVLMVDMNDAGGHQSAAVEAVPATKGGGGKPCNPKKETRA